MMFSIVDVDNGHINLNFEFIVCVLQLPWEGEMPGY